MSHAETPEEILRVPEVERQTKLHRATIYRKVKAGTFPAPRKLGPRATGWFQSEVQDWIKNRPLAGSTEAAA